MDMLDSSLYIYGAAINVFAVLCTNPRGGWLHMHTVAHAVMRLCLVSACVWCGVPILDGVIRTTGVRFICSLACMRAYIKLAGRPAGLFFLRKKRALYIT